MFYIVERVFVFFFLFNFNPPAQRVTLGGQPHRRPRPIWIWPVACSHRPQNGRDSSNQRGQRRGKPSRLPLPLLRWLEERSSFISWTNFTVYVSSWLLGSRVGRGICAMAVSERTGSRAACQSAQPWKAQRAHNGGTWTLLSWGSWVLLILKLLSVYNLSKVRPPWELPLAVFIPLSPVQCWFNYQSMLQSLPLYLNILKYYGIFFFIFQICFIVTMCFLFCITFLQ